jgi:superfamily I DNA and/or RNA helicase
VALRAVDAALAGREEVGRRLLAAAWSARLGHDPVARAEAGAYAQQLASAPARSVRARMPGALGAFPVWAVTSLSAGNNFPLVRGLFDVVVIDEASQSDLASALPLLYRAKRALIVGDPHQLAHITTLTRARDAALARDHFLTDDEHAAFGFKATSLFAAAERAQRRPPLLLRQHFRSHPDVIGFANRAVYGGRLVVRTPPERLGSGRALSWRHVEGPWERPAGRSVRKPVEAEAVVAELARLWPELAPQGRSVGVVSPFRAQVELLRDLVGERLADLVERVTIDTAHGFQGDERDLMIFSVAVAGDLPAFTLEFAGDRHLVNVAVTRARTGLVVVGDHRACLAQPTLLGALARYAADLGAVVP